MDLLSGKRLYSDQCRVERDCGNGNNMKFGRKGEAAFQQALKGEEVNLSKLK
jgi:hypothetical protein